ncbi:MAG TPA: guanine deaminase [Bryobacteraceae bacterium]|nr:guanine deaminase [Bryobacteraceae bacterium]
MAAEHKGVLLRAAVFHTPRDPFLFEDALEIHADGGLLIVDGRVAACGDYAGVQAKYPESRTRDLRPALLLPGFIDTHVHYPQIRILGGLGYSLLDWLQENTLPEEAKFADLHYARAVAAEFIDALAAHGTTTAAVYAAHFAPATAALFEAAARKGVRIASGLVLSDRLLRPELHLKPQEAYDQSKHLIAQFHGKQRLLYSVTPRFAISASEAILEVCQTLLREHPDLRVQTHLNENVHEVIETSRLFPWAGDYLAVYERFGLVGPLSILGHNVHSTDLELQRVAQHKASIAHCPCSNAALGSGIFPLRRHLAAGVRFALGTDVGGGIGFGMLKEALQAYLVQRLAPEPFLLHPEHLLYLATRAGAEALGLKDEIGDFTVGKAADFVVLRPREGTPLAVIRERSESPERLLSAVFTLAAAEDIAEVYVAGTLL